MNKTDLGKYGEKLAGKIYVKHGYEILHKNWRYKKSEIDIIVRKGQLIVFVEVKYRNGGTSKFPVVTSHKLSHLRKGINGFLDESAQQISHWQLEVIYLYKSYRRLHVYRRIVTYG